MSNSINDLNAIYSSQIQEAHTGVGLSKTKVGADTITPADAAAVGQHVRAIKYEARKSGEPLPRVYNEYVSKNNLTATQRRITRQKLGLAEETSMPHVSKNDKKAIKTRYKGLFKKDLKGTVAGVNENLSNWREDFELREVDMPSTGVTKKKRPKTSDKSREEITDKDVNNKVIINPTMGELTNSFEIELEKIGGTLVEMVEIKEAMVDQLPVSPAELIIQKRMAMLNMKLARKNREKVNKIKKGDVGVKDQITAQPPEKVKVKKPEAQTEDAKYGYDSKGNSLNPKDKKKKKEELAVDTGTKAVREKKKKTLDKIKKDAEDILKQDEIHRKIEEDYKSKKTSEVIKALTKKKGDFKKRYGKDAPDVMYAVAAKTAKKKGDTSKSDDRYAYEEVVHEGKCDDCTCEGCGPDGVGHQNPCVECGGHHKDIKEALSDRAKKEVERDARNADNPLHKPGRRTLKQLTYARELALKNQKKKVTKEEVVDEAKVDTGSAEEKATARNKRNTPPGANRKFDTSVFITRKPGESLDSARTRKRRDAHAAKRGVKEDKAFDNVVSMLRKKHGDSGVITKDSPKPKSQPRPKAKPQKPLTAKEKAHREVVARYGGEANYKAGRGLGT